MYFDGTGDWITTPSDASLGFGTGDFCVEMWVYRTGAGSSLFHGNVTNSFVLNYNGSNQIVVRQYGIADLYTTSASVPFQRLWRSPGA